MSTPEYFAEHPTPRMLAAEKRRADSERINALLDASSLGSPGAKAVGKLGAIYMGKLSPDEWTEDDERLANEHLAELGEEMTRWNRRRSTP